MTDDVTRYVHSRDGQIAYRVIGSGPSVVWVTGTIAGLAYLDDPLSGGFFRRIAESCRLIVFDPRGCGRSDPVAPSDRPDVSELADDVAAVLDDAGAGHVVVWGYHAGAAVAATFAARYPQQTTSLFIVNGFARQTQADGYPYGFPASLNDSLIDVYHEHFGTGMFGEFFSPSRAGDVEVKAFYARMEQSTSRAQAVQLTRMAIDVDVRDVLAGVNVPTLVMHNRDNTACPVEHGRYLAAHIPGARLVEFSGTDQNFMLEDPEPVLIELEAFVTGNRPSPRLDHGFLAVVFTDLVTSTEQLAEVGDRRWRELIDRYERDVGTKVGAHGGRVVKSTGDGILAVFPVPSRALRCAGTLVEASTRIGLRSRVGVHAGEVELRGDDVSGLAVNIAARVCALAEPMEVLVTRTITDILAGVTTAFTDRGSHALKGISEPWELYRVD
jgi:class 3 adenylate cyclase/pimeloyl-ACP methyl ester carboxylesterase